MFASKVMFGLFAAMLPAWALAAQLLVLNKSDATLSFINVSNGARHVTVPTGDGPHEIELLQNGTLAAVGNYGAKEDGNTISIFDVATRKELRRIDLGELKRPHGFAIADGKLYFTAERAQKIGRLNREATKVEWTFATNQGGTHMILASRDGRTLYTTNMQSDTVSVIERADDDEWTQTLITVGAGPEALDLSPDGRELWVGHSRDGGISIIDTASKTVAHQFDAKTKRSNRLKFTHDGRFVLVSDLGAGELVVFDARKRAPHTRLALGRSPTGILIPANSSHAYITISGENRIAMIDLKTFDVTRTITTGGSPDGMAWVE